MRSPLQGKHTGIGLLRSTKRWSDVNYTEISMANGPGSSPHCPGGFIHRATNTRKPPSDSLRRNTAIATCTLLLGTLGEIPLPGIKSVTTALISIINSMQDVGAAKQGWERLADRLARLKYVVEELYSAPEMQGSIKIALEPLIQKLGELTHDLETMKKKGKRSIEKFFTGTAERASIYDYDKAFDGIVNDLTLGLCARTALRISDIEIGLNGGSEDLKCSILPDTGMGSFTIRGNDIRGNDGSVMSGMKFWTGMDVNIEGNSAVDNKEDVFSGIVFRD